MTEDQAKCIYKKVELGDIINISTMKQEIDQDWELNELDDTGGDINPYRELIVHKAEKVETVPSQMEQWSILSDVVNYIQYYRYPQHFNNLHIKATNEENHKWKLNKEEERQILELDFGNTPEKLKEVYLDIYNGIQSEILSTTRFDKNSDLSTTYFRKVDMTKVSKIKAEETFPLNILPSRVINK